MIVPFIIIFTLGALLFSAINSILMHYWWRESPGIVQDYKAWKQARSEREATSEDEFTPYKNACLEEQRQAKYTLHSALFVLATALWPLTLALLVLYVVLYLPLKVVKFAFNLPKIFESAKGF